MRLSLRVEIEITEKSFREQKGEQRVECRVLQWAVLILFMCAFSILQKSFGVSVEKWDCRV